MFFFGVGGGNVVFFFGVLFEILLENICRSLTCLK